MENLSPHALQFFIAEHLFVQLLLHSVKEVGAALVLPAFDVDVKTVAVFRLDAENLVENRGKLFERHIAVVDTAHLVDAVGQLHEVNGVARPLQGRGWIIVYVARGCLDWI